MELNITPVTTFLANWYKGMARSRSGKLSWFIDEWRTGLGHCTVHMGNRAPTAQVVKPTTQPYYFKKDVDLCISKIYHLFLKINLRGSFCFNSSTCIFTFQRL